ncbi:unnamed protein product [Rhizoctonia solani]|uniref:AAA+ ATPase domain-containing protein n=1 Tax=Rhizoctonia solani TaxID=456999 RepID=A0A8H3BL22_9AGAM|nr:unnamed protein product [Rhizoctonia solani]
MAQETNPTQDTDCSSLPPTSLIDDAYTQLSLILNSSAAQCDPPESNGLDERTVILYCPIEGGESVVDATIQELSRKANATVETLDLVRIISELPGSFWRDAPTSSDDTGDHSDPEKSHEAGYFQMHDPLDSSKLIKLIGKILSSNSESDAKSDSEIYRRIVYIRDFGFLATFAPTCYKKVIETVHSHTSLSVGGDQPTRVSTVVILGASPLLIKDGLFQKSEPKKPTRRDSSPDIFSLLKKSLISKPESLSEDESSSSWEEGKNANKPREQRLRRQHEMWVNNLLLDHIHEHLAKTGVWSQDERSRWSRSKRIPTCIVVPEKRNPEKERQAREKRRLELNELQIRMALLAAGGELGGILASPGQGEASGPFTDRFKQVLADYDTIKQAADRAVLTALVMPTHSIRLEMPIVSWEAFHAAWKDQEERDQQRASWLKSSEPVKQTSPSDSKGTDDSSSDSSDDSSSSSDDSTSDNSNSEDETDPIVRNIKKQGMNSYERQMLDCLIHPGNIRDNFNTIHLPDLTIDTIRTLVSLRLACPQAFETGILKQYNMSGALLFGPPGTGKTLLAKAIAKESGARMLSIKPSDILEKCVGEDEKNIRALFKLARRLKPCVIFIDEADALFGARISAKQEKSARWRTDMLTQFTQEMDGMLSSDVTVICATNRPFDLDDAIIRRLPCRMLVDLPDTAARKAILGILLREENLGADVDLMELANQTPQFSGSDLKHVCVMAAYESAKELANISWNDKKGKKPDSSISLVSGLSLVPPESGIRQADEPVASGSETGKDKEPTSDKARIREIGKRHFAHALGQVRASTSETQNSLVELRRWDQKFGSSSHSNRSAGLAIPGASLPVSGKPWMNGVGTNAPGAGTGGMYGSDMYGSGTHGPGMYGNGMYGMGTSMSYMSEMGAQGMNGMTRNPADANYVAPPPGSYLKSLGVQFEPMY